MKMIIFSIAIFLFFCLSCVTSITSNIHEPPSSLAVENLVSPVGIGDTAPEFSWITKDYNRDKSEIQTAYQIIVASSPDILDEKKADMWNSEKVISDNSAYIRYEGKRLLSRGEYFWKVRTWNEKGNVSSWSAPAQFEMGLLSNSDWQNAKWIWRENKEEGSDYSYFRKTIEFPDKQVARARIYITACNRYELFINGELVGKGPNFAYPDEYYYQTFDIGSFLQAGAKNIFGLLGVHWGQGGQGRPKGRRGLLFKIVVDFSDGTSLITGSDRTWKTLQAEEWKNTNAYRSGDKIPYDFIDGRLHPVGWNKYEYDDSKWNNAVEIGSHPVKPWINPLIAQNTSITEYEINPIQVFKIGKGHFVADFGKVYTGMPKLTFSGGNPGRQIKIKADYHREEDGTLKGVRANSKMFYEYTLRGGEEIFRSFWYLGFRYLEVENAPETFDNQSIQMIVRHHQVDTTQSAFECSDPMINNIWELAKRSAMLSSHEHFVDNPTREQGQFTADAYMVSVASMKCFLERNLSCKGIKEFARSQVRYHQNTGKVNAAYPNNDGKRDIPDWTQHFIFWAWDYYMQTGDRELIDEIFEQLLNTGNYNKNSENKQSGLIDWGSRPVIQNASDLSSLDLKRRLRRTKYSTGLIDWPDDYGYDAYTSQRTVLSINAYLNYLYISRLAGIFDKKDTEDIFKQYANEILSAIRRQLWDKKQKAYIDGLYEDGTKSKHASQQANAMMLALSLTEEGQEQEVMNTIKAAGHSTGVLLIRFLIQAYAENGDEEALFEYLINPDGHNWAYIIANGGTFTWEAWRLWDPIYCESQGFGAIGAVMAVQDYILGVKPILPQYAKVQIKPHLTGKLSYARGRIPTQRGHVHVDWQNNSEDESFSMTVKIPFNITADVYIPKNGSTGTAITVNGVNKKGKASGGYTLFENIKAGEHVFVREK